jgi:hypothetical protein
MNFSSVVCCRPHFRPFICCMVNKAILLEFFAVVF